MLPVFRYSGENVFLMGGAQEGAYGWLAVNYLHQVPARLVPARSHSDALTRLRNSACEEELPRDAYESRVACRVLHVASRAAALRRQAKPRRLRARRRIDASHVRAD